MSEPAVKETAMVDFYVTANAVLQRRWPEATEGTVRRYTRLQRDWPGTRQRRSDKVLHRTQAHWARSFDVAGRQLDKET